MPITQKFAEKLSDYDNRNSLGRKLRTKRIAPLLEMIDEISAEHRSVNVIDIGGTENYWNIVSHQYLEKHNVNITIVNLPGSGMTTDHGLFRFIEADGCNLAQIPDKSFDIAHSNSVLEHVGDWEHMVRFSEELSRVSHKYFVQTPSFWFPMEPHFMTPFFHWFPKSVRIWLVIRYDFGHFRRAASIDHATRIVESVRLLNKKRFQELFKEADIMTERMFLMPKSFIAIKR